MRRLVLVSLVSAGSLTMPAPTSASDTSTRHPSAGARVNVRVPPGRHLIRRLHVPAGASVKKVVISEPSGAIRLFRMSAPAGTRADVIGAIPGLAGVGMSTPGGHIPTETCARRGTAEVCTQGEEGCPMPAAVWHFRVKKLTGPAGVIRLEFVVGRPPRA